MARRQDPAAVQGLILRDNGYLCDEGLVYYFQTKQRIGCPLMINSDRNAGNYPGCAGAAVAGIIPPPRCFAKCLVSLGIVADETSRPRGRSWAEQSQLTHDRPSGSREEGFGAQVVSARDDLRRFISIRGLKVERAAVPR